MKLNKLEKAIKVLEKRLPKSHFIQVKPYKTIYSLMNRVTNAYFNGDKKECFEWYSEYLNNPDKATYMNTKYYPKVKSNYKPINIVYTIAAIAGNPILIAYNSIKHRTVHEIMFLLLHEMGHHYYERRYNEGLNERWCDEFAIVWIRRLIKEGL